MISYLIAEIGGGQKLRRMKFNELLKAPIATLPSMWNLELVLCRLNINKDDSVLDVGLGTGFETFMLSNRSKEIVGIDISEPLVKFLNKHHRLDNASYIVQDATKEPPNEFFGAFDKCISLDVLEHVEDPKAFLNFITKTLRHGGWLGITFPINTEHGRNHFTKEDVYELFRNTNLNADIKLVTQTKFGLLVRTFYAKARSILKPSRKKADVFDAELAFEMMQHPKRIYWLYKFAIILLFKLSAHTFYTYSSDESGNRVLVIAQKF